jgi:hypothetical protein
MSTKNTTSPRKLPDIIAAHDESKKRTLTTNELIISPHKPQSTKVSTSMKKKEKWKQIMEPWATITDNEKGITLNRIAQITRKYDFQFQKTQTLKKENFDLHKISEKDGESKVANILEGLLEKLSDQLMWPINLIPIKNPVILKSGITIDEDIFKKLDKDPFDSTKACDLTIPNLLAKNLKDIINDTKKQMDELSK